MIRCKINGRCYVGQSTNIKSRWNSHRYKLRHDEHPSKEMNKDWNIYGEDNFEFKIIQECTKDELEELEKKYTKEFKAYDEGYNQIIGGHREGYICSEDTRKKLSELGKNKTMSEEARKKISENNPKYWKGKHFSEETKKKISESLKGKKLSEETKKKMSENHADYKGDKHPKAIMLLAILPSGLILEPMIQIELSNLLGISHNTIINLRRNGEPYKPRCKKFKHLEGLRILEIPKENN